MLEFRKYNNVAGIYKWENKINHKCYIGQSIDIGSRLRHHVNSFIHKRYINPLYKALEKYGIDNFEVEVLFEVPNPDACIKPLLDQLEIAYIETYNSYGHNGYNQTRGGDAGILGYKFTNEQRRKVSEYSKRNAKKLYVKTFIYNLHTEQQLSFESISSCSDFLNCSHSQVSRLCAWKQKTVNGVWVGSFDKDLLQERVKYVTTNLRSKSATHRKSPTPGLKRQFNTATGKKTISDKQKEKIRNSSFKYRVAIYKDGDLVKLYKNTLEANEFFNYKNPSTIAGAIRKYNRNGYKFKGQYIVKLI